MKKRSLIETNMYLADPVKRRTMFILTVISSSAVEGVRLTSVDLGDISSSSGAP